MRILLFFDLPQKTGYEKKIYSNFRKKLISEGFIMVQFSVYSKLCVNHNSAQKLRQRIEQYAPESGDIRYLVISEVQYNSIRNINNTFSIQEKITNTNRLLILEEE